MIEVTNRHRKVDWPYLIHVPGVTEEAFDELTDEDIKAELLDGVMIVHSPTTGRHDLIVTFLGFVMGGYADAKELGTVSCAGSALFRPPLPGRRRFAPDAYLICQERVLTPAPKVFPGAPDLVVEVLSPSTRTYDLGDKRSAYRDAQIEEIWLVDDDNQQLHLDRKRRKRYAEEIATRGKISSSVLPGFWVDCAWLWADPLPNRMACLKKVLAMK